MRAIFALLVVLVSLAAASPAAAQWEPREHPIRFPGDRARIAPHTGRDVVRVIAELGFGMGVVASLSGVATATSAPSADCSGSRDGYADLCGPGLVVNAAVGGTIAGLLLMPGAVTLGAHAAGGRGHAGGAYLGFLVGGVLSLLVVGPLALVGSLAGEHRVAAGLAAGGVFGLIGSIVGYELTHQAAGGTPDPPTPVLPFVTIDATGATLGATGTL